MRRHLRRGFTAVEILVVVVIVTGLAAMAYAGFGRLKQRAGLNGAATELHAAIFSSRQSALATGHRVVVMVFPDQATAVGTGRIVLYEDAAGDLFTDGAATNFADYDAKDPSASGSSAVLDVIDLPTPVVVGPEFGQGKAAAMPAPFSGVAINTFCSFCTGTDRRGALAFDQLGFVTFHAKNGVPLDLAQGGSLSITSPDSQEIRTFVVQASTGAVQTLRWSPTP